MIVFRRIPCSISGGFRCTATHSAVHEHLQTLRRWYKVKRREAPPSQPTCSSGALFGYANSRLSSVISQKQMCAKYRTLPVLSSFAVTCKANNICSVHGSKMPGQGTLQPRLNKSILCFSQTGSPPLCSFSPKRH